MSRIARPLTLLLVFAGFAQPQAHAQANSSVVPACPAGNLLKGKLPVAWQEVARDRAMLTDETVAPEGAVWDAALAAILETGASTVTWDLGEVVSVRSLAIQADANDTYNIWGSLDGKDYKLMGQIDPVTGHGLRMRTLDVGGMAARFLRVGEGKGDGFYSVSEVAAYCQTPTPFPPQFKVTDAPAATAPKSYLDYWNNDASARWEMIFAMLGAILLWWERRLVGLGMAAFKLRLRRILLGVMGVLAFLTFFNFGFWHFPNFVHGWDTFHYYIGSKYFKELHYERLYECVATADSEEPGLRRRVELRKMTNLRTNVVEKTDDILAHPERCKQHFTEARWESFKHDLRYFRTLENPRRWDDAQTDHGFNGTPVWAIMGTALSNLAPASRLDILLLDSLDVMMISIMALLMWWAFGWRAVSVALIVFATNFPSRWYWIGGSFLRWDWLFWMGVGVCLMKKERPFWAGAAIAYAALLRIFPGFMFVAPLIALGYHYVKTPAVGSALPAPDHGWRGGGGRAGARQFRGDRQPAHLPGVSAQHGQALGDAADQLHGAAHRAQLPPGRGGRSHEYAGHGGSLAALERGAPQGFPRSPAALPVAGRLLLGADWSGHPQSRALGHCGLIGNRDLIWLGADLLLLRLSHYSRPAVRGGSACGRVAAVADCAYRVPGLGAHQPHAALAASPHAGLAQAKFLRHQLQHAQWARRAIHLDVARYPHRLRADRPRIDAGIPAGLGNRAGGARRRQASEGSPGGSRPRAGCRAIVSSQHADSRPRRKRRRR